MRVRTIRSLVFSLLLLVAFTAAGGETALFPDPAMMRLSASRDYTGIRSSAWSGAGGDFNVDGWRDLVSHDWKERRVAVHLNRGDGTFVAAPSIAAQSATKCNRDFVPTPGLPLPNRFANRLSGGARA